MKGRAHTDATKAAALAALLEGQSVNQVARAYKLPVGTVKKWSAARKIEPVEHQKEIGELLLEYLRENLITLRAQAVLFRDPNWMAKQDAGEVAVLHGVLTDKAVRLFEALGNAAGSTAPSDSA